MYVITGASDGLGLELATLLVAKGKQVVSLSRRKPKLKGVEWLETDLLKDASIETTAKKLLDRNESIEALVNCAGVFGVYDATALDGKEIDKIFRTNVMGPMLLTSRLLPRIKQDEADIANVVSTAGTKPTKEIVYSASKWGTRGFSLSLQAELYDTPCRVITFCPGGFVTDFFDKAGRSIADPQNWMTAADVAALMLHFLELPKNMEITEVIINRKAPKK